MPDSGTARADFPGGDARQLWRSIQRILQLPSETRLFTGMTIVRKVGRLVGRAPSLSRRPTIYI